MLNILQTSTCQGIIKTEIILYKSNIIQIILFPRVGYVTLNKNTT